MCHSQPNALGDFCWRNLLCSTRIVSFHCYSIKWEHSRSASSEASHKRNIVCLKHWDGEFWAEARMKHFCLFYLPPQNRKQSRGDVLLQRFARSPTPGSIPRRGASLCGVCILSLCERVWVLSRGNFSFLPQYKGVRVRLTGVSKSSVSVNVDCCFSRSVARGGWDRLPAQRDPECKRSGDRLWMDGWMDGNNAGAFTPGSNFWEECSTPQPAASVEPPRNSWLKPRRIIDGPISEWQQVS